MFKSGLFWVAAIVSAVLAFLTWPLWINTLVMHGDVKGVIFVGWPLALFFAYWGVKQFRQA